jgi:restriction endonuclease
MTEKMTSSIKLIKLDTATFHGEKVDSTYVNFFFGKNGAGKSTLADAFRHPECLDWETGVNPEDYTILVYDQDFITHNLADYNPNVFQICTLKSSGSEVRKRQEVGRGMRLCVNQDGDRMDVNVLGNDVQNVNVLTVIASESYESFARSLQSEIAEAVEDRPRAISSDLFLNRMITDAQGNETVIDSDTAAAIMYEMTVNRYVDRKGALTDKYYQDKANGELKMPAEVAGCESSVVEIIDSIYDANAMKPENARSNNVELQVDEEKLNSKEFKALWSRINAKSVYVKLPDGFYISTPVGHYNPDWAIAFYEGSVKHIYFVAETKGSMSSMQLRLIEESKIHCAREHFKAISGDNVVYDVVDSYTSLLEKVMK